MTLDSFKETRLYIKVKEWIDYNPDIPANLNQEFKKLFKWNTLESDFNIHF